MSDPTELVGRLENDVSQIMELYEVAEKAYPYSNVHGNRVLNDN